MALIKASFADVIVAVVLSEIYSRSAFATFIFSVASVCATSKAYFAFSIIVLTPSFVLLSKFCLA